MKHVAVLFGVQPEFVLSESVLTLYTTPPRPPAERAPPPCAPGNAGHGVVHLNCPPTGLTLIVAVPDTAPTVPLSVTVIAVVDDGEV